MTCEQPDTYELDKQALEDIARGACFLASGGGGPLKYGQALVQNFPENGTVQVVSVKKAAATPDALSVMVGNMGSPDLASEHIKTPQNVLNAFDAINEQCNGKIKYVVPPELGAGSSIISCMVAAKKNIAVVDADGTGRAVPRLAMTTFAGKGVSPYPTVMANEQNEVVVLKMESLECIASMARPVLTTELFGQEAGLAMWCMDGQTLNEAVPIRGTLYLAKNVGETLRTAAAPVEAVCELLANNKRPAYPLFTGTVQLPPSAASATAGLDFGRVFLRDDETDRQACVCYQNESLIAWDSAKTSPIAMAPDSICYLTPDGQPFSNADCDLKPMVGKKATLVGIAADEKLTEIDSILQSFKENLELLGYYGSYASVAEIWG